MRIAYYIFGAITALMSSLQFVGWLMTEKTDYVTTAWLLVMSSGTGFVSFLLFYAARHINVAPTPSSGKQQDELKA